MIYNFSYSASGYGLEHIFGSNNLVALAAMQPDIRLGSLYDRRTDKLLPVFTLGNEDNYQRQDVISKRFPSEQQWFVDSENTFSSKVRKLEIESGLALSLLGGLVDMQGHAEYLKDTVSSSNVAKVSLTYKEKTVYQELTPDALKKIDYKDEFTHAVVGIQYGGTCTMVFERDIKYDETKEEIEEALSTVLKSIPKCMEATMKLNSDVIGKVDNFKCTIYSDIKSNESVTTWNEALSFYKSLSTKFSTSGKADARIGISVRIRLLPKYLLRSCQDTLFKELSNVVLDKLKEISESLTEAINESQDLLAKTKKFSILNRKVEGFVKLVENYTTAFRKDMSALLVSTRSGSSDEKLILDAVEKHLNSAFGYLNTWIGTTKWEVDTLLETQNQLSDEYVSNANTTFEQNIVKKTTNVVFTLKVCERKDYFIDEMESYYNNLMKNETTTPGKMIDVILNQRKWFQDKSLIEKIRRMAYRMRTFASANKMNQDVRFFMRETECEKTPDCCIDVWEKGQKLDFVSYEPPTEVRNLRVQEYSYNTMKITWNVSEDGRSNISNYGIYVTNITDLDKKKGSELFKPIKIPPVAGETMTRVVTNLQPGQEYEVSVQCLCLNDYAYSKSVKLCQMTRLSNPPVHFKGEVREKRHINLIWEPPTVKAEDTYLRAFLIECSTIDGKSKFSTSVPSDVRSHTITNLFYGTEYQFKILAYYDDGQDTLPSEDITLKTEAMEAPRHVKVDKYLPF